MGPGFLGKIADRMTLLALRVVIREVRGLRQTLEIGIDSYRKVNRLPPAFSDSPAVEGPTEIEIRRGSAIQPGAFQTIWLIEELCREFGVPITMETDLEGLAIDRGWIDINGRMLVLPAVAEGLEVPL
jgi:hypothetical protein